MRRGLRGQTTRVRRNPLSGRRSSGRTGWGPTPVRGPVAATHLRAQAPGLSWTVCRPSWRDHHALWDLVRGRLSQQSATQESFRYARDGADESQSSRGCPDQSAIGGPLQWPIRCRVDVSLTAWTGRDPHQPLWQPLADVCMDPQGLKYQDLQSLPPRPAGDPLGKQSEQVITSAAVRPMAVKLRCGS